MFIRIEMRNDISRMDLLNIIKKSIETNNYTLTFKGASLNFGKLTVIDYDNDTVDVEMVESNPAIFTELRFNPRKYIIKPNITSIRTITGRLIPKECKSFDIDLIDTNNNNMTIFEYSYFVLNKYHIDPPTANVIKISIGRVGVLHNNSQYLYMELMNDKNEILYLIDVVNDNISVINKDIDLIIKLLYSKYKYSKEELMSITSLPSVRINNALTKKKLKHLLEEYNI